jgi:hypothetical protein
VGGDAQEVRRAEGPLQAGLRRGGERHTEKDGLGGAHLVIDNGHPWGILLQHDAVPAEALKDGRLSFVLKKKSFGHVERKEGGR